MLGLFSPPNELTSLFQRRKASHRRSHQKTVAFLQHTLNIVAANMRVPNGDVEFATGGDDLGHRRPNFGMIILAWNTELLAQVAFADQDATDAGHLLENGPQVADAQGVFDHEHDHNFAV